MLEVRAKKSLNTWFFTGLIMIYIMLIIGGITRLTGSGLSMVDWSPIMGALPPMGEAEWTEAFEQYKQFPEYQKVNLNMDLDEFKGIYIWEWTHRNWGRLIGLVFLIPFLIFLSKGYIRKNMRGKIFVLFILGGLQGGLGWFMVASGLKDIPHVSHIRLMIHLMAALLIMGYIIWLITQFIYTNVQPDIYGQRTSTRKWLRTFIIVLVIQIIYGAFMAGLRAGAHFKTWPDMNGSFIPNGMMSQDNWLANFTDSIPMVQFIHRLLPWVLIGLFVVYFIRYRKYHAMNGRVTLLTFSLALILVLQIVFGIVTLLSVPGSEKVVQAGVSIGYGVIHQALGVLLFILSLFLFYAFGKKKGIEGY